MSGGIMKYWIFKCNPDKYRIYDRLVNPERTTSWRVTRYRDAISPGDTAFIWPTGKHRGICAIVRIDSWPEDIAELEHELPYCVGLDTGIRCRVLGTIMNTFECISYKFILSVPALQNMSVFHGYQQATNFRLSHSEGMKIMDIINERDVL